MRLKNIYLIVSYILITLSYGAEAQTAQNRILVFSKTMRYYHESIPAGIAAIRKLGKRNNYAVDTTKDSNFFTYQNLKRYAAIVFLSTGGDVFDSTQQDAFQKYIRSGGGYVGIHAATTTEYDWPWYGQLVGAFFNGHPEPQEAMVKVLDIKHNATRHLPGEWKCFDEWYNFRDVVPGLHFLLTVDESTYNGGKHGSFHPLAWYHGFEGGRSFYTALGHFGNSFQDELFLKHISAGINYAMGTLTPTPSQE
jgi:uncharacterized protein